MREKKFNRIKLISLFFIFSVPAFVSFPISAFANEILLTCKGTVKGSGFRDTDLTFTVKVNMNTGELYGFPNAIALGCMSSEYKEHTIKYNVTDSDFSMDCMDPGFASSFLKLNRYTGILEVINIMFKEKSGEDSTNRGVYKCNISENRKF
jgi:hypothetical protein